jgi:hypothetical protein
VKPRTAMAAKRKVFFIEITPGVRKKGNEASRR